MKNNDIELTVKCYYSINASKNILCYIIFIKSITITVILMSIILFSYYNVLVNILYYFTIHYNINIILYITATANCLLWHQQEAFDLRNMKEKKAKMIGDTDATNLNQSVKVQLYMAYIYICVLSATFYLHRYHVWNVSMLNVRDDFYLSIATCILLQNALSRIISVESFKTR